MEGSSEHLRQIVISTPLHTSLSLSLSLNSDLFLDQGEGRVHSLAGVASGTILLNWEEEYELGGA